MSNSLVQCKSCSKWLKKSSIKSHVDNTHFEEYGIGTPTSNFWVPCDVATKFNIKKSTHWYQKTKKKKLAPL